MKIKKSLPNGLVFLLMLWISVCGAQGTNAVKMTSKEKLAAVEKACQGIIEDKEYTAVSSSNPDSVSSSAAMNFGSVLTDVSTALREDKSTANTIPADSVPSLNSFYSKEKFATLTAHSTAFIKKTQLLSQTLHNKADGLEAALKATPAEEGRAVYQKMGQALRVMGSRLDVSILELQKTMPYLNETYTQLLAVENELKAEASTSNAAADKDVPAALSKKMASSAAIGKNLYGVLQYLAAIKNCQTVVSKIQEDLAVLAKAVRSQK